MAVYFILVFLFCFDLIFEVLRRFSERPFGELLAGVTPMPGPSGSYSAEQRGQGRVLHLPITPRYDLSANNSFYRLGF